MNATVTNRHAIACDCPAGGGLFFININSIKKRTHHANATSGISPMKKFETVTQLTVSEAQSLAKFPGDINLLNLEQLSVEQAHLLAHRLSWGELESEESSKMRSNGYYAMPGSWLRLGLRQVEPALASVLASSPRGIEMPRIESLSPTPQHTALATRLVESQYLKQYGEGWYGKLQLNSLTVLEPEIAEVLLRLSDNDGGLELNGLQNISQATACQLSETNVSLALNGIEQIDSEIAAQLFKKRRSSVELNGLKEISIQLARVLSNVRCLYLRGLHELSDPVHRILPECRIGNETRITNTVRLEKIKNGSLSSASLMEVDHEWASELLQKTTGRCDLSRVKILDERTAQALADYEGTLILSGLEELPDSPGHISLAQKLARQNGGVFGSVQSIGAAVVKSLAGWASLKFPKLRQVPEGEAGEILLSRIDPFDLTETSSPLLRRLIAYCESKSLPLRLSFEELCEEQAALLSQTKVELELPNLCKPQETAAHRALTRKLTQQTSYKTCTFESLTLETAVDIANARVNKVKFTKLRRIDNDVAMALAKASASLSFPSLRELLNTPGHLALTSQLSQQKELSLPSLRRLAPEAAALLTTGNATTIILSDMILLEDGTANELATFGGRLHLFELRSLSDTPGHLAFARRLATQTYLELPRWDDVAGETANIIAEGKPLILSSGFSNRGFDWNNRGHRNLLSQKLLRSRSWLSENQDALFQQLWRMEGDAKLPFSVGSDSLLLNLLLHTSSGTKFGRLASKAKQLPEYGAIVPRLLASGLPYLRQRGEHLRQRYSDAEITSEIVANASDLQASWAAIRLEQNELDEANEWYARVRETHSDRSRASPFELIGRLKSLGVLGLKIAANWLTRNNHYKIHWVACCYLGSQSAESRKMCYPFLRERVCITGRRIRLWEVNLLCRYLDDGWDDEGLFQALLGVMADSRLSGDIRNEQLTSTMKKSVHAQVESFAWPNTVRSMELRRI